MMAKLMVAYGLRPVLYHDTGRENCVLKAQVTPSQRLNDKPREAWVGISKQTCAIIIGHYTCMARYVWFSPF